MNAERRKKIQQLRDQLADIKNAIEELQGEEQEYVDNVPENMQGGERYEKAEQAADALTEAADAVDEVDGHLEEAAQ